MILFFPLKQADISPAGFHLLVMMTPCLIHSWEEMYIVARCQLLCDQLRCFGTTILGLAMGTTLLSFLYIQHAVRLHGGEDGMRGQAGLYTS